MRKRLKKITKNLGLAILLAVAGKSATAQTTINVVNGGTYYVCAGSAFTAQVSPSSGYLIENTDDWTLNGNSNGGSVPQNYGGFTLTGWTLANGNSISFTGVEATVNGAGYALNISVTATKAGLSGSSETFNFTVISYSTTISTGPIDVCTGGGTVQATYQVSCNVPGATTFQWSNNTYSGFPTSFSNPIVSGTTATYSVTGASTGVLTVATSAGCPSSSVSNWAPLVTVTTSIEAPTTAPTIKVTQEGGPKSNEFDVIGSAVTGADYYVVTYSSGFTQTINNSTPGVIMVLTGSEAYNFSIQAVNACGRGPVAKYVGSAPPCSGCMASPIKPENSEIGNAFKVYPNPAQSMITIEYSAPTNNAADVNVDVYDMLGKKVTTWTLPGTVTTATEDISALPKGMYIYIVNNGNDVLERGKLVVQK